jgi:rhamnose transport system ATP-binding protein
MDPHEPHVEIRGLSKRFGATVALDDVTLRIRRGTVHALVGENGAGKSTLGKTLAGVHAPDHGEVLLAGRSVSFRSPRDALSAGLTIVAQELSLVPSRTVVENVFLGQEDHVGPWVRRHQLLQRFHELVSKSGITVSPHVTVGSLGVAEQQKVEILRALARDADLIVMDEPTARLAAAEAEALGRIIRRLAQRGKTVVLVSHFLEEVLAVSDDVTVLRDGKVVTSAPASSFTHEQLIESMIGRTFAGTFPDRVLPPVGSQVVLDVSNLTLDPWYRDVSLSVRAGEVVVLAGLVGAGRSEVARAIFGAEPAHSGQITLGGEPVAFSHPKQALESGLALIPEDRKHQGLQLLRSVQENITLSHLGTLSSAGWIHARRERHLTVEAMTGVGVKAGSPDASVSSLSGGNQQKVLFARALFASPRLLIADEPTRGVDVGAKRAIYDLIASLAASGMAVLVISSEMAEVLGLAHRVLVMRQGRIQAELTGGDITEPNIVRAAFGATPDFAESETTP